MVTEAPAAWSISGIARAFVAGVLSVLVFQYGLSGLLYAARLTPAVPYSMHPTAPFHVPQTISSAFWGGLWGIVINAVLAEMGVRGWQYWVAATLFGGIVVAGVLIDIVYPLKGFPFAAGFNAPLLVRIFCLHAAFGFGVAVWLRVLGARR